MAHQQRGEETRARLMAAAATCFTQAGYDATGVAEICQRAGVSKGGFYHHFPSKQDLFLALLKEWLAGLDAVMLEAQAAQTSAPQRLMGLAQMVTQVFEVAAGQAPMFLEFWRQAARDPAIWQATIEPYRQFRRAFSELIRAGMQEGSLAEVDPELAALVIVSLGAGLVLQGVLDPFGADWGHAAEEAVRIILGGIERKTA